jgi:hypothetical protein
MNGSAVARVLTADGETAVKATRGYLTGVIFTPGSASSTVTVEDGTTVLFVLSGASNGPSQVVDLASPIRFAGPLNVTVTGTGAACSVMYRE